MKTKSFITFAAFVAASALMSSCSNEENAATNGQLTAFTGGIVTEAPMTRVQLGASESSTVAPGFLTRTSMDRPAIGGKGTFFWEAGDVIYVQDDNNKLFKSQSNITEKTARNTFLVNGAYGAKASYDVYYYGTNSSSDPKKVVIAATQTQTAFNDTKHFGASGDCGVAKATKNTDPGKSGYKFDLEHKAAYLCFLPYITSQDQREGTKIQKIEVTSNNNIAGTYELSPSGLSGVGNSNTITLNIGENSSVLTKKEDNTPNIGKSLYMVIAPGMHSLSVKYTFSFTNSVKVMTVTKKYDSRNFEANKIYDIPVSLGLPFVYSGHNYYMWDAKENYWFGHEWDSADPWQPTVIDEKYTGPGRPAYWPNMGEGYFEASVNPLFKQLPNLNEISWYIVKGDPHWDESTKWEIFGKTYTGGIWLKKLSVIAKEVGKEPEDLKERGFLGNDIRINYEENNGYTTYTRIGKPKDSRLSNYFFLPALGFYYGGEFKGISELGRYWTSSSSHSDKRFSLSLSFSQRELYIGGQTRDTGMVVQPFE